MPARWQSLAHAAHDIVSTNSPADKVRWSQTAYALWKAGGLPLHNAGAQSMSDRPGRPAAPLLAAPRDVPKRGFDSAKGRIALLHAVAHIELNAIDMAWDLVGRFSAHPLPQAFFDDWVEVAAEEAVHFESLANRLVALGSEYGAMPAHDGLWQAASETAHDLRARLAIVPLILEARGLDVTPHMIERLAAAGDTPSAALLDVIYRDEEKHVAAGLRWFTYVCEMDGLPLEATFHDLVRRHFKGLVKPPFNHDARLRAGLSRPFYEPLAATVQTHR